MPNKLCKACKTVLPSTSALSRPALRNFQVNENAVTASVALEKTLKNHAVIAEGFRGMKNISDFNRIMGFQAAPEIYDAIRKYLQETKPLSLDKNQQMQNSFMLPVLGVALRDKFEDFQNVQARNRGHS